MIVAPIPNYRPPVDAAAFDRLDRVEVRDTKQSLREIRASLPHTSSLAEYLDDFLPGNRSQYLDGVLQPDRNGGWQLRIHVSIADETGELHFTPTGDFSHWG